MNATITYPATVRELGDMAEARGIKASELLGELLKPGALEQWAKPMAQSARRQ